jgi:hypothetical protein
MERELLSLETASKASLASLRTRWAVGWINLGAKLQQPNAAPVQDASGNPYGTRVKNAILGLSADEPARLTVVSGSNGAIVPVGAGSPDLNVLAAFEAGPSGVNLILDITGYFQ